MSTHNLDRKVFVTESLGKVRQLAYDICKSADTMNLQNWKHKVKIINGKLIDMRKTTDRLFDDD